MREDIEKLHSTMGVMAILEVDPIVASDFFAPLCFLIGSFSNPSEELTSKFTSLLAYLKNGYVNMGAWDTVWGGLPPQVQHRLQQYGV